jgi:hypothetical protein
VTEKRNPGHCAGFPMDYNSTMQHITSRSLAWTASLVLALLAASGPVMAADAAAGAKSTECVKVVRVGSRIPDKVCGDERDLRNEVRYPDPAVSPLDQVSRLGHLFPWLTVDTGKVSSAPR